MAGLGDTLAMLSKRNGGRPRSGAISMTGMASGYANPGALAAQIYVPPDLPAGSPLVVVLHGCTQRAEDYAYGSGWLELAGRFGFAVLAPEQTTSNNPNRCFNWFLPADTKRSQGEAASIAAMVRHAVDAHGFDRRRVFVTGLSAGGAMAAVMLATSPELFAGGGIVAGLPYGIARSMPEAFAAMSKGSHASAQTLGSLVRDASSHEGRWPTVSIWHGDSDRTVQPGAADQAARQWCDVHGVSGPGGKAVSPGGRVYRQWIGGDGRAVVELHHIPGMGHGTPISTTGSDACGHAGPFLLEAGISSSLEMAQSWGIAIPAAIPAERPAHILEPEIMDQPSSGDDPDHSHNQSTDQTLEGKILKTINDALRSAGLLR